MQRLLTFALLVTLVGCAPSEGKKAKKEFESICVRFMNQNPKYIDFSIDVRETRSVISPFVASVKFSDGRNGPQFKCHFAYQEERGRLIWILKEIAHSTGNFDSSREDQNRKALMDVSASIAKLHIDKWFSENTKSPSLYFKEN